MEQISSYVKSRENKTPEPSSEKSGEKTSKSSGQSSSQSSSSSGSVIELNDKNFEEKVLKSNDAWLVEFYSPGVLFKLFSADIARTLSLNIANYQN